MKISGETKLDENYLHTVKFGRNEGVIGRNEPFTSIETANHYQLDFCNKAGLRKSFQILFVYHGTGS